MEATFEFDVVDKILKKYPPTARSTIAILQAIQEYYHYLPEEIFPYVSRAIGIGEARLYGVATFYENFSLEKKGKYVIRCCDGTACHVRKSTPVREYLCKELQLDDNKHTTDDLMFTVETVSCLGACGLAPALMVNDAVYSKMTPEKAAAMLQDLRSREQKGGSEE